MTSETSDRPEPNPSTPPRREVPDSEYRTSYIDFFQLRIPEGLHRRLRLWAEQEGKAMDQIITDVIENAIRQRG